MHATRSRLALALVSIPVVVAVVLAGIWVTGGVITNSFTVSMWLTAAWMGLAGVVCLAIAVRSRLLRWPVVGAYVVTAAVAGVYLGSSVFLDKTVNEQVATAAPAPPAAAAEPDRQARTPRNVRLRVGRFESVRHPAAGTATLIRLAKGGRVLTLGNQQYEIPRGTDLDRYTTAVVWCRAFSVLFARAPTRA